MIRRGGMVPSLTVRVSHEATRLSKTHVAAAFERLVPPSNDKPAYRALGLTSTTPMLRAAARSR